MNIILEKEWEKETIHTKISTGEAAQTKFVEVQKNIMEWDIEKWYVMQEKKYLESRKETK